jgi:hypothetical protein
MRRLVLLAVVAVLSVGCYHATVETGRPAGSTTIEKNWAHGFLWGLVPPSTVETAQRCATGVAKVETQLSFLNMVANFITSGLYSPMTITVTCAQGGTADARMFKADARSAREALVEAAEMSKRYGTPVYVALR